MLEIKPIQTKFRGNFFRSRLEARWAAVLHNLELDYVYEPEGFVLPSGKYLPDFWVKDLKMYIEIKPDRMSDLEHAKAYELGILTRRDVAVFHGQPWHDEYHVTLFSEFSEFGGSEWCRCELGECRDCERLQIITIDTGMFVQHPPDFRCCAEESCYSKHSDQSQRIMTAFNYARSQRFERQ